MTDSYVEIDLSKLSSNIRAIMSSYPQYCEFISVVKGDCYGHGMRATQALYDGGIRYFAVSSLKEARDLRQYCVDASVLCLQPVSLDRLSQAHELNLTLAIPDMEYLNAFLAQDNGYSFKLHIQVDSGFNRLGFKDKHEIKKAVDLIENSDHTLEGIYQHYATAGVFDPHYDNQTRRFRDLVSLIDISRIKLVHLGSGVSLLSHEKQDIETATRMGLLQFGYNIGPVSNGSSIKGRLRTLRDKYYARKYKLSKVIRDTQLDISPAMTYKCRIIQLKQVKKGEHIGYNASYTADTDITIAVLPVGYNNGIGHSSFDRVVEINGRQYPVIGEIGMNMCCVKVDDTVSLTDEVTLLGGSITLGRFSRSSGLSLAQVLLNLGKNNTRIYK